jgi:hypothetical protein
MVGAWRASIAHGECAAVAALLLCVRCLAWCMPACVLLACTCTRCLLMLCEVGDMGRSRVIA